MNPVTGATHVLGWIVISVGAAATVFTIVAAFRFGVRPGEAEPDHPKRAILREDR
ncbi:MAG: hypothetical protein ACREMP_04910 [Candidatus Tyrphobacter sp.]